MPLDVEFGNLREGAPALAWGLSHCCCKPRHLPFCIKIQCRTAFCPCSYSILALSGARWAGMYGSIRDLSRSAVPQGRLSRVGVPSSFPFSSSTGLIDSVVLFPRKCLHRLFLVHPCTLPPRQGLCLTEYHTECIEGSRIFQKSDSPSVSSGYCMPSWTLQVPREGASPVPHPHCSLLKMRALKLQGAFTSLRGWLVLPHWASGGKAAIGRLCLGPY